TSIPGLSAKPIIDIMVFVYDINKVEQHNDAMKRLGYTARGENGMTGRRYFVKYKDDMVNHSHHVHIYQENGNPFIEEAFLFRDYLLVNKEAREKYDTVKKGLSKQFYYEPLAYTDGKHDCVMEILKEAKRYFAV
ncbi:MAG: GrpB family protein, partial [Oscillospiraceae bacterium]|nr:GrpB family protein [Oscillospiraceae bacterium]